MTFPTPRRLTRKTATRPLGLLAVAAGLAVAPLLACQQATAEPTQGAVGEVAGTQAVAEVRSTELRREALDALRRGELDVSRRLISDAAAETDDAALRRMVSWLDEFRDQRATFDDGRREEYGKQVEFIKHLDEAGYLDAALEWANDASVLADDKDAYAAEAWVRDLMARAAEQAEQAEAEQDWIMASRLYFHLSGIEPYSPRWRAKLKETQRRRRLLALYAPEVLETYVEAEQDRRKEVADLRDELFPPEGEENGEDGGEVAGAEEPELVPAGAGEVEEDGEDDNADAFRIDWREIYAGANRQMVEDALEHVYGRYRRHVSYRDLVLGGLDALEAVADTPALAGEFPRLGDDVRRETFLDNLDQIRTATRETPVDSRFVRRLLTVLEQVNDRTLELPDEVLVAEFADGALGGLDPFSNMIWPSDLAEFNKSTQGNFTGVGISIRAELDGDLLVVSPLEDSPAYEAGIRAGDVITRIDGKSAKNITTNKAVKTITGPKGTPVVLTIRRDDVDEGMAEFDVELIRDRITVKSVKGWRHLPGGGWEYLIDPDEKIAYLRITSFTGGTTAELRQAVRTLEEQGARGVILDLRSNPGGLLSAATDVSDLFLEGGQIVSTRSDRDRRDQQVHDARRQRSDVDLPLAVLVNQQSASASEIVSGALRDHDRAIVIGERTFGKGSVQILFPVGGGRAKLKLTNSYYYLPSGTSIHKEETDREWGVEPDLKISLTPDQWISALEAQRELEVLQKDDDGMSDERVAELQEQLLDSDPQLSAALLVLRLQLATPDEGIARG